MLGAPLHLGNLVQVVPPTAPLIVDASDGEPTWEDAAWQ